MKETASLMKNFSIIEENTFDGALPVVKMQPANLLKE